MKKFEKKLIERTDKINYISKSVLPIDGIVPPVSESQKQEVESVPEVKPTALPKSDVTQSECDLDKIKIPASENSMVFKPEDASELNIVNKTVIPDGVGGTQTPDRSQLVDSIEDDQDVQAIRGLTKGLSKLSKEQLLEMGLTRRSDCKVPFVLRCDEQTYDRLAEIKQRDRLCFSVIVYEAILYYINNFYAVYKDPTKPNNEEGALNKKSTAVKHMMGWAESDLRTVRIPLSIDDKTDYYLAKICRRTKQFKNRIGYDALIYYLNQFYKNITGFSV